MLTYFHVSFNVMSIDMFNLLKFFKHLIIGECSIYSHSIVMANFDMLEPERRNIEA